MELGVNDLVTVHPELALEWDEKLNRPWLPSQVSAGSDREFYWKCQSGHSYLASVSSRARGRGCKFCKGKSVLAGFNDLETLIPDLASEWDLELNKGLLPSQVRPNSSKKVWWKCKEGHSFGATVASRSRQKSGCGVCSGATLKEGENDLKTTHPELARQWDYEANYPDRPESFTRASGKSVYWRCPKNHPFQSKINARKHPTKGCSVCNGKSVVRGINDLGTTHPDLVLEWDFDKNIGVDPRSDVTKGSRRTVHWICPTGHSFSAGIADRAYKRVQCKYCSGVSVLEGYNDLATIHPHLAREWDFKKNTSKPSEFTARHHKKVFWICSFGHSYEASIGSRVNRKRGCPVCSGQRVSPGTNDLATINPRLSVEWDYERNSPWTPDRVTESSLRRFYWRCEKDHSYPASVAARKRGRGCPYCAGKRVLPGFNDLESNNPEIAGEWDDEKNSPLKPNQVGVGYTRKIFWICKLGHSYAASVASRTRMVSGCPFCAGRAVLEGFNDLETTHADIALEWDFEKNGGLSPKDITAGSGRIVSWICPEGHSFSSAVGSRTNLDTGCPKCAKYGFDSSSAGLFYLIRNDNLNARKVGITNERKSYNRIRSYGEGWRTILLLRHPKGSLIRDLEKATLHWIRNQLQLPPFLGPDDMNKSGGFSETFSSDFPSDEVVIDWIKTKFRNLKG